MKKSVFGYIRLSLTRPSQSDQESLLSSFADDGISFFTDSSSGKDRTGYSELNENLRSNKKADLVLYDLKSLDSCFSSLAEFLKFLALIEKNEITLICLKDNLPEIFTPLIIQEIYERVSKELHREHMQISILNRKAAGLNVGRPSQRDDFSIQNLRQSGLTYREIAQHLKVSIGMVQRGLKA